MNEAATEQTDETVASPLLRVGSGKLAATIVAMHFQPWLWVCGAVLILSVIAALAWGAEWFVAGLLVNLLLVPNILGMAYIFHGMKPVTARNTVPHRILLAPDCVVIEHFRRVPDEEDPERLEKSGEERIFYSEIGRWTAGPDGIVVPVGRKGEKGVIILEGKGFETGDRFQEFVESLEQRVHPEKPV